VNSLNFRKYLIKFENEVVLRGVEQGILGQQEFVACRICKSDKSRFAIELGRYLPYELPMVIDYYGYYKKSRGFFDLLQMKQAQIKCRQLKMISAVVVHFASIKIEEINQLTDSPYLTGKFAEFKAVVLQKRGFRGKSTSSKQQRLSISC